MIHVDFKPLTHFLSKLDSPGWKNANKDGWEAAVEWLKDRSKEHHIYKDRSKSLSNAHRTIHNKVFDSSIDVDKPYASFQYFGTTDHFIAPKSGGTLAFSVGGSTFFSKGHMVSGIKGDDWIERNYRERQSTFNNIYANKVVEFIEKATK